MSFNNIEIARLRIEEARRNGERDAVIRRVLAEEEGEQKASWLNAMIQRWIAKRAAVDGRQLTGKSGKNAASTQRLAAQSRQAKIEGRQWTADC